MGTTDYTRCMQRLLTFLCFLGALSVSTQAAERPVATYSIVAFDPATGDLGIAVQSKFFGVGSVVPWAKAGVGAVATQSYANTTYGPEGLKLMAAGKAPEAVLKQLTSADPARALRQVGMVDAKGRAASFSGERCNACAVDANANSNVNGDRNYRTVHRSKAVRVDPMRRPQGGAAILPFQPTHGGVIVHDWRRS